MNETEILGILDESLTVGKGTLHESDLLQNINEWDSIAIIMFLSAIEEKYGTTLDPEKLKKCLRVADLTTLVRESVSSEK